MALNLKRLTFATAQTAANQAVERSLTPVTEQQTETATRATIQTLLTDYPVLQYLPQFIIGLTIVELLILWKVWDK